MHRRASYAETQKEGFKAEFRDAGDEEWRFRGEGLIPQGVADAWCLGPTFSRPTDRENTENEDMYGLMKELSPGLNVTQVYPVKVVGRGGPARRTEGLYFHDIACQILKDSYGLTSERDLYACSG